MPLDQEPIQEKEMSFLEHLEELRWHVVRSLGAVIIFTIGAFVMAPWIFHNIIFAPARVDFPTFVWLCNIGNLFGTPEALCIEEIPFKVQSRYMTGQFSMHIVSSFVIGIIVAFPYITWELWRFIKPGLYPREKNSSRGAVASISFLFLTGILFGYYVMSPIMISFLANYQISDMIVNEFDITSYVGTIVGVVFGSGVLFQLPVVIFFLTKIGIVTPGFLRKYRKHAIVIILIVGAIVTPTADPLSQALISVPLYLLYEISILISSAVVRRKEKEEAEELLKEQQEGGIMMPRIAIGGDHAGFEYKDTLVKWLHGQGYETRDFGTYSSASTDYPDFAHAVADAVEKNEYDLGILICGSANGVAMTANKHQGIRAAICWNEELAALARNHNNANVLCLPARFIPYELGEKIADRFLHESFEGGRHDRRVGKISC